MMIKKLQLVAVAGFVLCTASTKAQLTIDNATFFIESGATVTVQGDILSNTSIQGPGKILLKGSSNQNVNMNNGGAATNAYIIPNLEVDNTSGVTLTGNAKVGTNLLFTNGKIQTGNFDLKLANTATVTGADNTKYVVTNGTGVTGRLIKEGLAALAFTYPIGNTTSSYNPVTISNSGTADDIGAHVLTSAYASGSTGTAFTKEVADASWDISEAVAGGSNLSITANWLTADELPGFVRTKAGLSYYIPTGSNQGWDLLNTQTGAAAGSGTAATPYSFTRTAVSSLGTFAVGTRPVLSALLVSPKVFLQGPYNTGTGVMADGLRAAGVIPTANPYDTIPGFTAVAAGGGETSTANFATTGNDAIVDWMFIQLHRATDSVVVDTRAVLIQRDGDVVSTDGVSPVNISGNAAGSYYISLRHRNHLGVRSTGSFALAKNTTTTYDFSNALAKAFAGTTPPNPAMADIGATTGTVYGMYGGNANADGFTRKTGSAGVNDGSLLLSSVNTATAPGPTGVYRREDFNMDANVRKTGSPTTNDFSRLLAVLNGANIITQPTF